MRGTRLVLGVIVSGALLGGCASAAARPAGIVSQRCTRCHSTDRIKAAAHDASAWKATIDRMRGKGAALTDAEEKQVIEFLAGGGAAQL